MNRVRELRIARGHESLREFARFVSNTLGYSVSASTLSLIENNKNLNPSWGLISTLADYFMVSSDYLMGKEDVKSNTKTLTAIEQVALESIVSKLKTA